MTTRFPRRARFTVALVLLGVAPSVATAGSDEDQALDVLGRALAHARTEPVEPRPLRDADFYPRDAAKERLGRMLFFDKILSGNLDISCATCHHPLAGTGDGLSLGIGQGGVGLGVTRAASDVHERVPRNAPPLFNLGAREYTRMFHDGRVEVDDLAATGFRSPVGAALPAGLDNVLAVQAMFPVTSATEMAGQKGENEVADATARGDLTGPNGVWQHLADRLRGIPEYVRMFVAAFDDVESADDIAFVHAANALAAYEAAAFRSDGSPFDRYLRGDKDAMSKDARRGMKLFYGRAGCAECHGGSFQTNHGFAAIAMPQIGPGKGHDLPGYDDGRDDLGREAVTGDSADRFRFRVPSLRNVEITGPYGHGGAYDTLEAVVRHHLQPRRSLRRYDRRQAMLPPRADLDAHDFAVQDDPERRSMIEAANELRANPLSDRQVSELLAFLRSLTDPRFLDMRREVPMAVPSGLPIYD